ncbi:hypothetical protein DOTSEDRAFT_68412 [Dothistroma septosporum NZE10]|uniref:Ferric oxidoreductase domain-containing protein n=1 Tax=Dothistroma septosporum (strain NZE10 / CBS 128990) TaxID=675120 RepID=N1Q340_DOTSN|nr:hypothetical protein DOTSEDRAFT_68412 [Dothistroma septosporum NZE10]
MQTMPLTSFRHKVSYLIAPTLLLSCAGLTIGLTYAPCYSSYCVEYFFPYYARIHIALFYGLLAAILLSLTARTWSFPLQRLSQWHVSEKHVPLAGKPLSGGAFLLSAVILGATFGSTAYWYDVQQRFWFDRGAMVDWTEHMFRLAWCSITGHWCDIWAGLVVIPVGRNSILGNTFNIHSSTLLLVHKLLAYGLFVFATIHGLFFFSWLDAYLKASTQVQGHFQTDNPAYSWEETDAMGYYYAFTLPIGLIAGWVLIPVMIITGLPWLRRKHYNAFYFTHIILAFLLIWALCVHSSTGFYFLLPGLVLWVADWLWRTQNSLYTKQEVQVEYAGNDWCRIRLPSDSKAAPSGSEKSLESGHLSEGSQKWVVPVSSSSPIATYYLNIGQISRLEAHPFSAVYSTASESGPVLLFQRGPAKKGDKKRDKEWTWKLSYLAHDAANSGQSLSLSARIEGPYHHHVPEMHAANHILLLVGGTGVTAALSVASWWAGKYSDSQPPTQRSLRLIWSTRGQADWQLQEVEELRRTVKECPNMELVLHDSTQAGRVDPQNALDDFLGPVACKSTSPALGCGASKSQKEGTAWTYVSGPEGLMKSAEAACVRQQISLRKASKAKPTGISNLTWYISDFNV